MADTFENVKIFEDEIGLYLMGFIDREQLKDIINDYLYNEYEIRVDVLPDKFNSLVDILEQAFQYGLELMAANLKLGCDGEC